MLGMMLDLIIQAALGGEGGGFLEPTNLKQHSETLSQIAKLDLKCQS